MTRDQFTALWSQLTPDTQAQAVVAFLSSVRKDPDLAEPPPSPRWDLVDVAKIKAQGVKLAELLELGARKNESSQDLEGRFADFCEKTLNERLGRKSALPLLLAAGAALVAVYYFTTRRA